MRTGATTILIGCALMAAGCWDFSYVEPENGTETGTGTQKDAKQPGASDDDGTIQAADGGMTSSSGSSTPAGEDSGIDGASSGCTVGGLYCGGHGVNGATNLLLRCTGGTAGTVVMKCATSCIAIGPGGSDGCSKPADDCVNGGAYCGGDKVNGDPDTLYRCGSNQSTSVITRCSKGCIVMPPGQDDACRS